METTFNLDQMQMSTTMPTMWTPGQLPHVYCFSLFRMFVHL